MRPPRNVQLLGGHPSVIEAPVLDGWASWVIGDALLALRPEVAARCTRIFDVHDHAHIQRVRPALWTRYQQAIPPQQIVLRDLHPAIPQGWRYPLERVQAQFVGGWGDYGFGADPREQCLGSSLDQMIALALLEGVDAIRLDGMFLRDKAEYVQQRASACYWIGRARGMGVEVIVRQESGLGMVPILYGYDTPTGAPNHPGQPRIVMGIPGVAA